MSKPILATRDNMRKYAAYGVVAFDRYAHESYSASDGDYWQMSDDKPLTGMFGKPLILARHIAYMEALTEDD